MQDDLVVHFYRDDDGQHRFEFLDEAGPLAVSVEAESHDAAVRVFRGLMTKLHRGTVNYGYDDAIDQKGIPPAVSPRSSRTDMLLLAASYDIQVPYDASKDQIIEALENETWNRLGGVYQEALEAGLAAAENVPESGWCGRGSITVVAPPLAVQFMKQVVNAALGRQDRYVHPPYGQQYERSLAYARAYVAQLKLRGVRAVHDVELD